MRLKRLLLSGTGFFLLFLGAVGTVVPVLPTTPFVLAAAGCFASSPRMHARIMKIPMVNEYIRNYKARGGISRKTVVRSLIFLWAFLLLGAWRLPNLWIVSLLAVVGISVTAHILYVSNPRAPETLSPAAGKRFPRYFEALFNTVYLYLAITAGIVMLAGAAGPHRVLAGAAALTLGAGDAFHLLPRIVAALTGRQQSLRVPLAFGKLVTSVTMTMFYVLLCLLALTLYSPANGAPVMGAVSVLAAVRVILCLLPQNRWFDDPPSAKWGVLRNIPFLMLGILTAVLYAANAGASPLRLMWAAIALSFLFYMPVVLWAGKIRALGMLMLPKTCAYLWMLWMLFSA